MPVVRHDCCRGKHTTVWHADAEAAVERIRKLTLFRALFARGQGQRFARSATGLVQIGIASRVKPDTVSGNERQARLCKRLQSHRCPV